MLSKDLLRLIENICLKAVATRKSGNVLLQWKTFKEIKLEPQRNANGMMIILCILSHRKRNVKPFSSACCMFCPAIFGNTNLAPSHLQKHLKTQYPNRQNNLKAFFEASLHDKQKQVSLLESQVKSANKDLVLASLKMAHVVMKRKRPYTELESVVLPCLEIAADILHGGKKAVTKVREIPLLDNTTKRRCDDILKDLLK